MSNAEVSHPEWRKTKRCSLNWKRPFRICAARNYYLVLTKNCGAWRNAEMHVEIIKTRDCSTSKIQQELILHFDPRGYWVRLHDDITVQLSLLLSVYLPQFTRNGSKTMILSLVDFVASALSRKTFLASMSGKIPKNLSSRK